MTEYDMHLAEKEFFRQGYFAAVRNLRSQIQNDLLKLDRVEELSGTEIQRLRRYLEALSEDAQRRAWELYNERGYRSPLMGGPPS